MKTRPEIQLRGFFVICPIVDESQIEFEETPVHKRMPSPEEQEGEIVPLLAGLPVELNNICNLFSARFQDYGNGQQPDSFLLFSSVSAGKGLAEVTNLL